MDNETGGRSTRVTDEYFPVPVDAVVGEAIGLDLYLVHDDGRAVLYRAVGSAYSRGDYRELADRGVTHLYVPLIQHRAFQALMTRRAVEAYEDPELGRAERTKIVRECCAKMIEDYIHDPSLPGLGGTISEMAERFSRWCTEDESKFAYLMDMSEHDFYTAKHMVNVGVGCGLLGTELYGKGDERIKVLMHGGLVHDIGKCAVSCELLNKTGKLTDADWAVIRKHPRAGYNKLRNAGGVNGTALDMTLNHHERLDGKGYPEGLRGNQISTAARICGVVDVYDAMSSARPYRGAIAPAEVLKVMRGDAGTALDAEVFAAWERVIVRLLASDPERAEKASAGLAVPSLDEMFPRPAAEQTQEAPSGAPAARGRGQPVKIVRRTRQVVDAVLVEEDDGYFVVRAAAQFEPSEMVVIAGDSVGKRVAMFTRVRPEAGGGVSCVFRAVEAERKAG